MKKWSRTNVIQLNFSDPHLNLQVHVEASRKFILRSHFICNSATVLMTIPFEFAHWGMDVGKSKLKKSRHH